MGLTGWIVPLGGVLVHAPHPASIACLLHGASPDLRERLEHFCGQLFQIHVEITEPLGRDRRLRPLVQALAGTQLMYFDDNLARFGRSSSRSIVNDKVCRAIVAAKLATGAHGAAEAWASAQGAVVRSAFDAANIRLTMLAGGIGGNESVAAHIKGLSIVVITLASTVQKQTEEMAVMRASLVRLSQDSALAHHELGALGRQLSTESGARGCRCCRCRPPRWPCSRPLSCWRWSCGWRGWGR